MNEFKFYNVGEGLFYRGSLDNHAFEFVYDCGSEIKDSYKTIDNILRNDFVPKHKLDLLVISHLHKDHTNGIQQLILYTGEPKQIILPYYYRSSNNLFLKGFLFISGYNNDESQSILKSIISNRDSWRTVEDNKIDNNNKYEIRVINNHFFEDWNFLLLNKSISSTIAQQIEEDISKLIADVKIEDYINKNPNKALKELTKIYKDYIKDLNISSTIMIHWPSYECFETSVLTGDAYFDKEIERKILDNISCYGYCFNNCCYRPITYFQVPHHGAEKNFSSISDSFIRKINNFYISFGFGNKYRHPGCNAIYKICSQRASKIHFAYNSDEPFFYDNAYRIK